eukprot:7169931-Pyramimonas_sp.AAC.1
MAHAPAHACGCWPPHAWGVLGPGLEASWDRLGARLANAAAGFESLWFVKAVGRPPASRRQVGSAGILAVLVKCRCKDLQNGRGAGAHAPSVKT